MSKTTENITEIAFDILTFHQNEGNVRILFDDNHFSSRITDAIKKHDNFDFLASCIVFAILQLPETNAIDESYVRQAFASFLIKTKHKIQCPLVRALFDLQNSDKLPVTTIEPFHEIISTCCSNCNKNKVSQEKCLNSLVPKIDVISTVDSLSSWYALLPLRWRLRLLPKFLEKAIDFLSSDQVEEDGKTFFDKYFGSIPEPSIQEEYMFNLLVESCFYEPDKFNSLLDNMNDKNRSDKIKNFAEKKAESLSTTTPKYRSIIKKIGRSIKIFKKIFTFKYLIPLVTLFIAIWTWGIPRIDHRPPDRNNMSHKYFDCSSPIPIREVYAIVADAPPDSKRYFLTSKEKNPQKYFFSCWELDIDEIEQEHKARGFPIPIMIYVEDYLYRKSKGKKCSLYKACLKIP